MPGKRRRVGKEIALKKQRKVKKDMDRDVADLQTQSNQKIWNRSGGPAKGAASPSFHKKKQKLTIVPWVKINMHSCFKHNSRCQKDALHYLNLHATQIISYVSFSTHVSVSVSFHCSVCFLALLSYTGYRWNQSAQTQFGSVKHLQDGCFCH